MRYLSRDSFARVTHYRRNEYHFAGSGCAWCGQLRFTKKGRAYLYRYCVEEDQGRSGEQRECFCSRECSRAYHGT